MTLTIQTRWASVADPADSDGIARSRMVPTSLMVTNGDGDQMLIRRVVGVGDNRYLVMSLMDDDSEWQISAKPMTFSAAWLHIAHLFGVMGDLAL